MNQEKMGVLPSVYGNYLCGGLSPRAGVQEDWMVVILIQHRDMDGAGHTARRRPSVLGNDWELIGGLVLPIQTPSYR